MSPKRPSSGVNAFTAAVVGTAALLGGGDVDADGDIDANDSRLPYFEYSPTSRGGTPDIETWYWRVLEKDALHILTDLQNGMESPSLAPLRKSSQIAFDLLHIVKGVKDNKDNFRGMALDAATLVVQIYHSYERCEEKARWPGKLIEEQLMDLVKLLTEMKEFVVGKVESKGKFRLLTKDHYKKRINEFRKKLEDSVRSLQGKAENFERYLLRFKGKPSPSPSPSPNPQEQAKREKLMQSLNQGRIKDSFEDMYVSEEEQRQLDEKKLKRDSQLLDQLQSIKQKAQVDEQSIEVQIQHLRDDKVERTEDSEEVQRLRAKRERLGRKEDDLQRKIEEQERELMLLRRQMSERPQTDERRETEERRHMERRQAGERRKITEREPLRAEVPVRKTNRKATRLTPQYQDQSDEDHISENDAHPPSSGEDSESEEDSDGEDSEQERQRAENERLRLEAEAEAKKARRAARKIEKEQQARIAEDEARRAHKKNKKPSTPEGTFANHQHPGQPPAPGYLHPGLIPGQYPPYNPYMGHPGWMSPPPMTPKGGHLTMNSGNIQHSVVSNVGNDYSRIDMPKKKSRRY